MTLALRRSWAGGACWRESGFARRASPTLAIGCHALQNDPMAGGNMKYVALLAAAALAVLSVAAAQAEPVSTLADGRTGKIEYESITPTGFFGLVRRNPSPKMVVTGVLTLPPGTDKVPAMVIAHGSGG